MQFFLIFKIIYQFLLLLFLFLFFSRQQLISLFKNIYFFKYFVLKGSNPQKLSQNINNNFHSLYFEMNAFYPNVYFQIFMPFTPNLSPNLFYFLGKGGLFCFFQGMQPRLAWDS
jgi:hypothetical protein